MENTKNPETKLQRNVGYNAKGQSFPVESHVYGSESTTPSPTINTLKAICGKVQVPVWDHTEIMPGLILGGVNTVKQTKVLKSLKVTHILNAAYDKTGKGNFIYVQTNEEYFQTRNFPVVYKGIRAPDTMRFKINRHFDEAIEFIHEAISSGGTVYVHCYLGISRSAMFVLAYLMTKHNKTAVEAVQFVRAKREIFPNDGFLEQLLEYDLTLQELRASKDVADANNDNVEGMGIDMTKLSIKEDDEEDKNQS